MIISRELRKSWDMSTNEQCYQMVVSYVASDGTIKYMTYNLPNDELFEWDYSKKSDYYYPNFTSWDNKQVKRVKMKGENLSKERFYQILFDLNKNNQINDIFSLNYPETYFWDIETDISDDGFPLPQLANMPITVMSWVKFPNIVVFGTKPLTSEQIQKTEDDIREHCANFKDSPEYKFEYRYYPDEYSMLVDFTTNYFAKAPAVTGWNIWGFDYLYYYNRCEKFGIDLKCLSPTQKMFAYRNDNGDMLKLPKHKLIYDYLACYKKWDRTVEVKEANTLDFVGYATCGVKKVQHQLSLKDMWEQQPREYIFYNAIDSVLVEQIDKKIKTSKAMYGLAALTKAEVMEVFGTVASVEIVQNEYLYRMNKVIPLSTKKYEFREYEGAFVFKPEPSISKWVLGLDYASLYPSTERQFNMSPETYMFKNKQYIPKENEIKAASGSVFKRDEEGFMPMLLTSFYNKRKQHKKSMKIYGNIANQLNEIYNERIKEQITNININDIDFNPYNCSLEELQNKIDYYDNLAGAENDFQMAVKLFINSVYGCLGTRYYNLYNPDIAEAITLQGQDLIKYSAEKIDQYVSDYWHLEFDAHIKIANYMKEQFAEFDVDKFLNKAKKSIIGSETNQVGGDSVVGSSIIKTTDGDFTIEELFNECTTDRTSSQKLYVKSNRCIYNVNDNNEIITSKIKYIIRHKVDKDIWTLCSCGNYVHATEDHSFIVIRNDEKINVKPWQICKYDNVIIFDNGKSKICKIDNIFKNNLCDDVFVYDIEVETNNEHEHNFFANNILVHNTDSVSGNSIIITEKHKDGIKIEDFYNENINNIDNEIDNKHEAVKTDDKVLNWDNNLYFGDINRIIRHKVSKKKWQLKTKSGKIIECTDDHSLIVFRNGEKMKIKPHEILPDDKVLSIVDK